MFSSRDIPFLPCWNFGLGEEVARDLGPVDVLINNAGGSQPRPLDALTVEDFDAASAINLRSAFLVKQATLVSSRARRWSRIINISSVAAQGTRRLGLRAVLLNRV